MGQKRMAPSVQSRPARPRVTARHVRALIAVSPRSVLVWHRDRLVVTDPDTALALAIDAGARVLCTRADVSDTAAALRGTGAVRDATAAAIAAVVRDVNTGWDR